MGNVTAIVRRLDSSHDMTFGRGTRNIASGAEATAQRLKCRLLMLMGEWFLDTTAGVPWFFTPEGTTIKPIMGVKPRDLGYAESVLKSVILGTDGVASIVSFLLTFDGPTRRAKVACTVVSVDGDVINILNVTPPTGTTTPFPIPPWSVPLAPTPPPVVGSGGTSGLVTPPMPVATFTAGTVADIAALRVLDVSQLVTDQTIRRVLSTNRVYWLTAAQSPPLSDDSTTSANVINAADGVRQWISA